MAELIVGLIGVLVGAGAALGGQLIVRRRQERERWVSLLLEECSRIYALEDTYTGAIWEAFGEPKNPGRLQDWSRADRLMAQARLTIICTDDELISTLNWLRDNGRAVWHAASNGDTDEWARLRDLHRDRLTHFVSLARTAARKGRTI